MTFFCAIMIKKIQKVIKMIVTHQINATFAEIYLSAVDVKTGALISHDLVWTLNSKSLDAFFSSQKGQVEFQGQAGTYKLVLNYKGKCVYEQKIRLRANKRIDMTIAVGGLDKGNPDSNMHRIYSDDLNEQNRFKQRSQESDGQHMFGTRADALHEPLDDSPEEVMDPAQSAAERQCAGASQLKSHPLLNQVQFDGAIDPSVNPDNRENPEAARELENRLQAQMQNQLGASPGMAPNPYGS